MTVARAAHGVSRRKVFGGVLATAVVTTLGAACGPAGGGPPLPPQRRYRLGYVKHDASPCGGEPSDWQATSWGALRVSAPTRPLPASCPESVILRTLEERGYRNGDNLELTIASPPVGVQNYKQAAEELVARKVDLIITWTTSAALAARDATTTIPIVVHNLGDVVESGLVTNLPRPGGNITGVAMRSVDMALKRVELLRDAFPAAKRPLLIRATQPSQARTVAPALELAVRLGLSPVAIEMPNVVTTEALAKAKQAIAAGADSIVILAGQPSPATVLSLVKEHRLPAVFNADSYMDEGGALSLDTLVDYVAVADYIDKILKGAKPGDLPILLPTDFELYVNLKAADALGTPIAPSVVARATREVR